MKYIPGDIVEGVVTGIKPYGAFVSIDKDTVGLIHISEISSGFVKDVSNFAKLGDKVRVKVIDIDKSSGHLRLSLKALQQSRRNRSNQQKSNVHLPESKLGFSTIAQHLNEWIEDKIKELKK